ncbi:helix-turn-helix domain-containing protein [Leptospira kmetyi]|uniref:helix-turn-helix domain-containing protein n=1 Tax=Leptospira kmetyi TaxID=408139 RepID=UPI001082B263|nr:helix-turn-helix domain-containing protein [Leptospira kmetyi]TGK16986.1 AraC family transcriptional regulator [Leptospira kmetyi]TGK32923.1 AraC family transcriptional regulator [Leptospira kmetyi]
MTVIDFLRDFVLIHEGASTYLICVHGCAILMSFLGGVSEFYKYRKTYLNLTRGWVAFAVCACLILNNASVSLLVSPEIAVSNSYHRFFFGVYYGLMISPCLSNIFSNMYLLKAVKNPEPYCNASILMIPALMILSFLFPNTLSFVYSADILLLGIEVFLCVWSAYSILRWKRSKIYLSLSFMNVMMFASIGFHIFGLMTHSEDSLRMISWIPSHMVLFCILLEYNRPGIFAFPVGESDQNMNEAISLSDNKIEKNEIVPGKTASPKKNLLQGIDLEKIEERFAKFVADQGFKDEEIRLPDFAAYLGLSVHQASYYLNQFKKLNFSEFINYHRVEEVKKLIRDNGNLNLLEIALTCGFNSPASFHRAVLKFEGVPPRELKRELQKRTLKIHYTLAEDAG